MRVFTSAECQTHDPGEGHPDRPIRLATVLAALEQHPDVSLVEADAAPRDTITRCHAAGYLDRVVALCATGGGELGPDTPVGPRSWQAARSGAGAVLAALGHAMTGGGNAFAAIRPPGHHALGDRAMGFCIINHVAIAAAAAHDAGAQRVLIVDWDVHHGNGTQALVERDPATRFVSMHQWPWYPGTGAATERGVGNCFNLPMAAGLPRAVYIETLWRGIELATTSWTPEVVLISAGYDAMRGDPLGGFTLEPGDYAEWVARLGERLPGVPLMAVMEGGYAPDRLAAGVVSTVQAMSGH